MSKTCCFTGHRPKYFPWGDDESDERCTELKTALDDAVGRAIADGYTDFYCGMAQGFDTFAAECVLSRKARGENIRLHAAIPCLTQAKKWSDADKERYAKILDMCDTKTVISPFYSRTCMTNRNIFMLENSEMVIAYWNGDPDGGTAHTISQARRRGIEVRYVE